MCRPITLTFEVSSYTSARAVLDALHDSQYVNLISDLHEPDGPAPSAPPSPSPASSFKNNPQYTNAPLSITYFAVHRKGDSAPPGATSKPPFCPCHSEPVTDAWRGERPQAPPPHSNSFLFFNQIHRKIPILFHVFIR